MLACARKSSAYIVTPVMLHAGFVITIQTAWMQTAAAAVLTWYVSMPHDHSCSFLPSGWQAAAGGLRGVREARAADDRNPCSSAQAADASHCQRRQCGCVDGLGMCVAPGSVAPAMCYTRQGNASGTVTWCSAGMLCPLAALLLTPRYLCNPTGKADKLDGKDDASSPLSKRAKPAEASKAAAAKVSNVKKNLKRL